MTNDAPDAGELRRRRQRKRDETGCLAARRAHLHLRTFKNGAPLSLSCSCFCCRTGNLIRKRGAAHASAPSWLGTTRRRSCAWWQRERGRDSHFPSAQERAVRLRCGAVLLDTGTDESALIADDVAECSRGGAHRGWPPPARPPKHLRQAGRLAGACVGASVSSSHELRVWKNAQVPHSQDISFAPRGQLHTC